MRFLHLISSVNPKGGGPVEALCQIGAVHQALGHRIEAASLDAANDPCINNFPFPLYALGPGWSA